jgi:hypothetical protein
LKKLSTKRRTSSLLLLFVFGDGSTACLVGSLSGKSILEVHTRFFVLKLAANSKSAVHSGSSEDAERWLLKEDRIGGSA